jgi:hypothetical protein
LVGVVATNRAHAVRGPKHVVKTGKATVLDIDQARTLLGSIDVSTVVICALIALMTYRINTGYVMRDPSLHDGRCRIRRHSVNRKCMRHGRHRTPVVAQHQQIWNQAVRSAKLPCR